MKQRCGYYCRSRYGRFGRIKLFLLTFYNILSFLSIKTLQIIPQSKTKFEPAIYKKCTKFKRKLN